MSELFQTTDASSRPLFDPMSPNFIRDPYPSYARLRSLDPVHLTQFGIYLVSRHADVSVVLRDKRFGKEYIERNTRRYGPKFMDDPVFQNMRYWLSQLNPPDHTRLRNLMTNAFTARRVEDLRPRIQAIVDSALDRVADRGHMDLIEDFAFRLPITVICDMLGIPEQDRDAFCQCFPDFGRVLDPTPMSRDEIEKANTGILTLRGLFQELFDLRRKQPGEDLTTQLVQSEEEGKKLSNDELHSSIVFLFAAGHETTVNLIGNALFALFRNPDQLTLLKRDPSLIGGAVEEFLRYDSSVQVTNRVALTDIDDLADRSIPKGAPVLCLLGSANRDPAVYPDCPDRLDIMRRNVRLLPFGGGIHFCIGAQLARIETEIAITSLFRRFPDIWPDDLENPKWRPTFVLRGLETLPARW